MRTDGLLTVCPLPVLSVFIPDPSVENYYYPFASDPVFPFWAQNRLYRAELSRETGYYLKSNPFDSIGTNAELIEKLRSKKGFDDLLQKRLKHSVRKIPGTKSFMTMKGIDLKCIIRELGSASMFLTFSCADHRWPDIHNHMPGEAANGIGRWYSDRGVIPERMIGDQASKRKNLRENPHIASSVFVHRAKTYMEALCKTWGVDWYWYRLESQNRGSWHIHCLLRFKWDKGENSFINLSNAALMGHYASLKLKQLDSPDPPSEHAVMVRSHLLSPDVLSDRHVRLPRWKRRWPKDTERRGRSEWKTRAWQWERCR